MSYESQVQIVRALLNQIEWRDTANNLERCLERLVYRESNTTPCTEDEVREAFAVVLGRV